MFGEIKYFENHI